MVRVPQTDLAAGGSPRLQAFGVQPFRDYSAQQMADAGRSVQFAGQVAQRLGDRWQEEHDLARAKQFATQYREFGDTKLSKNGGFRSRLGLSAKDGVDDLVTSLETRRTEMATKLENERQRQLFQDAVEGDFVRYVRTADEHTAQQTRVGVIAETQAEVDNDASNLIDMVEGGSWDDRTAALHIRSIKANIGSLADLQGLGPEEREKVMRETMTRVHGSVVKQAIVSGDLDLAQQYLGAVGEEMDPSERGQLGGVLQARRAERSDRAAAMSVVDEFQGFEAPGLREIAALQKLEEQFRAGKLTDEQYSKQRGYVQQEIGDLEKQREAESAQVWKNLRGSGVVVTDFDDLPDDVRAYLMDRPELEEKVRKWIDETTDEIDERGFRAAVRMKPEEFRRAYPTKDRLLDQFGHMSKTRRDELDGLFDIAHGNAETKNGQLVSRKQLIEKRLLPHLWAFRSYDDQGNALTGAEQRRKAGLDPDILQAVADKIDAATRARGQDRMSPTEQAKVVDEMMLDSEFDVESGTSIPREFMPIVRDRRVPVAAGKAFDEARTAAEGEIDSATRQTQFGKLTGKRMFQIQGTLAYSQWLEREVNGGLETPLQGVALDRAKEEFDRRLGSPGTIAKAKAAAQQLLEGVRLPGEEAPMLPSQVLSLMDPETRKIFAQATYMARAADRPFDEAFLQEWATKDRLNAKQFELIWRYVRARDVLPPASTGVRPPARQNTGPTRSPYPTWQR